MTLPSADLTRGRPLPPPPPWGVADRALWPPRGASGKLTGTPESTEKASSSSMMTSSESTSASARREAIPIAAMRSRSDVKDLFDDDDDDDEGEEGEVEVEEPAGDRRFLLLWLKSG